MQIVFSHNVPHSSGASFYQYAIDHADEFKQRRDSGLLKSHAQNRRDTAKDLPQFYFDYCVRDVKFPEVVSPAYTNCLSIQRHAGKERVYDIGYVDLKGLLEFNRRIHHNSLVDDPDGIPVHLFVDNITESKASARSVCVYAIKFEDCALTYPIVIARPVRGGKKSIDYTAILTDLIDRMHKCNLRITHVVADAPKRAELRCVLQHNADMSCDYCKGEVTTLRDTDGRVIGKGWLIDQQGPAPLRTKEWMREVLDNWQDYSKPERFGITGESPLFAIKDLDPIYDMPPEYMHSMCLGVVGNLVELTMAVNKKRPSSNASFKRIPVESFNIELNDIKVPREFSRRVRQLDPAVWKAEEYRNLILFFFPIVIKLTQFPGTSAAHVAQNVVSKSLRQMSSSSKTVHKSRRRTKAEMVADTQPDLVLMANSMVRTLWNLLAFLLRLYTLPREEYAAANINTGHLMRLQDRFVRTLAETHGDWNCPYNVHQVTHLHLLREKGPFWHTSAFYGECMFAKLQRVGKPQSNNPIKVQFNCIYSSWKLGHACQKSLLISPPANKTTTSYDDSFFYTFEENEYAFFRACKVQHDSVLAHKVIIERKKPFDSSRYGQLLWHHVGVFTYIRVETESQPLETKRIDIRGKAIVVEGLIMTIANGLLRETATT